MDNRAIHPSHTAALESLCRFYATTCGLPARVLTDLARIEFRAGDIGAVTMPGKIGARVKARLEVPPNNSVAPIISHPRSKRWTFLVCPDLPSETGLWPELFRHNVSIVPIGAYIALPALSADPGVGYREWVDKPTDGFRPRATEIIEAVLSCVSLVGRSSQMQR
ncbi:DNA-directed RNA polymerase subunit beta [Nocardia sp. NPDC057030]|uniref:DNA-directed RNA polymerase subunit beta n=1 Tax=unclassified Nocardia TaxID=2637762 RepID=UPI003641490F